MADQADSVDPTQVTFIGDVHGWSDRLDRLLAKVQPPLVFMGDLIDRGPDAPGVLARVHGLCSAGNATCLLGNHEYALLHGLGSTRLGLARDPRMFQAWQRSFGGDAVMRSYGLEHGDHMGLSRALGAHLDWLEDLPWVLTGRVGPHAWIAVHAGLSPEPFQEQVGRLKLGWKKDDGHPAALFDKQRAMQLPCDLPTDHCVISGHTAMAKALVTHRRILCDSSGGMPGRDLSAVVYPSGQVLLSAD